VQFRRGAGSVRAARWRGGRKTRHRRSRKEAARPSRYWRIAQAGFQPQPACWLPKKYFGSAFHSDVIVSGEIDPRLECRHCHRRFRCRGRDDRHRMTDRPLLPRGIGRPRRQRCRRRARTTSRYTFHAIRTFHPTNTLHQVRPPSTQHSHVTCPASGDDRKDNRRRYSSGSANAEADWPWRPLASSPGPVHGPSAPHLACIAGDHGNWPSA